MCEFGLIDLTIGKIVKDSTHPEAAKVALKLLEVIPPTPPPTDAAELLETIVPARRDQMKGDSNSGLSMAIYGLPAIERHREQIRDELEELAKVDEPTPTTAETAHPRN